MLSALVGTLCTIGACLLVLSWEYRVAEIEFQSRAKNFVDVVNTDLSDATTLLYTVAGFIDANDDHPLTGREFGRFSKVLHRRVIGLRDTGWAPRVTLAQRPAFERAARAAGLTGYEIRQRDAHGRLVTAPSRPVYYPVEYIEAGGVKRGVLGIDLIAESRRSKAVGRAFATGEPAATPPIDVTTVARRGGGVLSYMTVLDPRPQPGTRTRSVRGVVLGVFEIEPMLENIIAKAHVQGLDLYLFNPAAPNHRVIYRTPAPKGGREPTERALLAGANWQGTVVMIDQHWGAIVTPRPPLGMFRASGYALAVLLTGLTITAAIIAYLRISLGRTLQLEMLTTALHAKTVELHRHAEKITYLSRHDPLTGLPNRSLFHERIDDALERSRRNLPFALLYLDLDRFKSVNDTLGHSAGDLLLCAVAERMNTCVRGADTSARLGGDEFAILIFDAPSTDVITIVADRLIRAIGEPYVIEGRPVVIGVSIGVAVSTADATAEGLLKAADIALYEAKAAGRGKCCFFDDEMLARVDRQALSDRTLSEL